MKTLFINSRNGIFSAVGTGLTVGDGASVAEMTNEKGVTIQLDSTTEGLSATLVVKGIQPIPLTGFHCQFVRDIHIPNSGSDKASLRPIAVAGIPMKTENMNSISFLFLTVAGFCPVLFSSCATTGNTSSITTPSGPGRSIPSTESYNPAGAQFDARWPLGPNTYR